MTYDPLLQRLKAILEERLDRQTMASRIAEAIRRSGPHRWVGIYDVDYENRTVTNIAWNGPGPPAFPTFSVNQGLTSRAIASRDTVNVGNVADDADYLTALGDTRSEIIIPFSMPPEIWL